MFVNVQLVNPWMYIKLINNKFPSIFSNMGFGHGLHSMPNYVTFEVFCLLRYNALQFVESQPTVQRNMLPPSSGSKKKMNKRPAWRSVGFQSNTLFYIPEDKIFITTAVRTSDPTYVTIIYCVWLFCLAKMYSSFSSNEEVVCLHIQHAYWRTPHLCYILNYITPRLL
jgi:hypothetical protein